MLPSPTAHQLLRNPFQTYDTTATTSNNDDYQDSRAETITKLIIVRIVRIVRIAILEPSSYQIFSSNILTYIVTKELKQSRLQSFRGTKKSIAIKDRVRGHQRQVRYRGSTDHGIVPRRNYRDPYVAIAHATRVDARITKIACPGNRPDAVVFRRPRRCAARSGGNTHAPVCIWQCVATRGIMTHRIAAAITRTFANRSPCSPSFPRGSDPTDVSIQRKFRISTGGNRSTKTIHGRFSY